VELFSYLTGRDPLTRPRRRLEGDIRMTCKICQAYEDMGCILYVWFGICSRENPCNQRNELSGFIMSRKYLVEQLSNIAFTTALILRGFNLEFTVCGVRVLDRYEPKLNSLNSCISVTKDAEKLRVVLNKPKFYSRRN